MATDGIQVILCLFREGCWCQLKIATDIEPPQKATSLSHGLNIASTIFDRVTPKLSINVEGNITEDGSVNVSYIFFFILKIKGLV